MLFIQLFLLITSIFFESDHTILEKQDNNVIIVTLDGLRWQEIFNGPDSVLFFDKKFNSDIEGTKNTFWDIKNNVSRREKLTPFIWNNIAKSGVLIGNRNYGNNFNVANIYNFSYPGYNEIFTGYPDSLVNTNDKIINKNDNVLGYLNSLNNFRNKVAVFSTWDVFPSILNEDKYKFIVNSDVENFDFNSPTLKMLNEMQKIVAKPINVRPDILTYYTAKEYLKSYHPKVLYISFDETDDYAHNGQYDQYLKSLHAEDAMISNLWNTIQSIEQYKNKTTLIITCDHGRGDTGKPSWKSHGQEVPESSQIWLAAIGNKVKNMGEVKQPMQLYQKQIASTLALLMGESFTSKNSNHPVGKPLSEILK